MLIEDKPRIIDVAQICCNCFLINWADNICCREVGFFWLNVSK